MKDRDGIRRIVEEIQYLSAKQRQRRTERLDLVVVHGHHQPETECLYGETIEYLCFGTRRRQIPLCLSPTGLLIADCIAQHRLTPLTAAQIERILSSDPFYLYLGSNATNSPRTTLRPKRSSIKVSIQRIRIQLAKAIARLGLNVSPDAILVSEATDSNVVAYSWNVHVQFLHVDAVNWKAR